MRDKDDNYKDEIVPFLMLLPRDFERDLDILEKILYQLEQRTHSENAYIFSNMATMAAGWWFYDILFKPDFAQKIFQLALPLGFPPQNKKAGVVLTYGGIDSNENTPIENTDDGDEDENDVTEATDDNQ